MSKRRPTAEERAKIFKALSDPRRVEIVDMLAKGDSLCGTELAERLGISLALVCHHWEVLVDAGVLRKERVGQLRLCTLDKERLTEASSAWEGASSKPPSPKPASSKPGRAPAVRKSTSK